MAKSLMNTSNKASLLITIKHRLVDPCLEALEKIHSDANFLIPLTLVSGFLLTYNIDNYYIGQDEGDYAVHALNVIKNGVPKIDQYFFDPHFTINGIWAYHPWLGMYLNALSISILGNTTLAAKFFPILCTLFAIFPIYNLALRVSGNRKDVARLTALFFALSVTVILHGRSARYYAYGYFFAPLVINCYLDFIEKKSNPFKAFTIISILYFYASFSQFFGVMVGIGVHFLIFHRHDKQKLIKFFTSAFLITIFTIPWLLYFPLQMKKAWEAYYSYYLGTTIKTFKDFPTYIQFLLAELGEFNNYIFPIIFIFFLPTWFFPNKKTTHNKELWVIPMVIFFMFSFLTLHNSPAIQYVTGSVPLFFILLSLACIKIKKAIRQPYFIFIIFLLIFTNYLHTVPWKIINFFEKSLSLMEKASPDSFLEKTLLKSEFNERRRFVLVNFIQELSSSYDSSLKAICQYINQHKKNTDTFLAAHEELEVFFYTGLKPARGFPFKTPPNWIIPRINYLLNPIKETMDTEQKLKTHKQILDYIKENDYKKIVLPSIDLGFENSTNLDIHYFEKPKEGDPIIIYHKN